MNPIERIHQNICHYEDYLGHHPDVIYLTRAFFESILRNPSSTYMIPIDGKIPDIFGMEVRVVNRLDGLDFQCFSSGHLNTLGDRYKKDPRFSDYCLEFRLPRFESTDISFVGNNTAAPTIADAAEFKNMKIIAANEVLRDWVGR